MMWSELERSLIAPDWMRVCNAKTKDGMLSTLRAVGGNSDAFFESPSYGVVRATFPCGLSTPLAIASPSIQALPDESGHPVAYHAVRQPGADQKQRHGRVRANGSPAIGNLLFARAPADA